ncbi:helix-turn-helix domain-containing protein [Pedobacter foliorum]|uniref:helix-turn-helix domain-containing protein n=1 Tax=Pedobacter foliorum TaxID=2739058 RepID=UPI001564CD15|nr:helix-turn-helix domain-containing protein [Pedobacter foliorum]NRF40225.1 helix-turn-helix domain-containing protein [Pedobacter foliorum]
MRYTFEQLPEAISILHEKVDSIKDLLIENQQGQHSHHSDLMTIGQAAEFINLSVPTLYTKVSRRQIPVNKRGKRLYFSKDELSAWIKSGRKGILEETPRDIKASGTDQLLNAREAAKLINYRRPTLYGLVRQNKIPYSKTAGKLLFSRNKLLEWVGQYKGEPKDESPPVK